MRKVYFLLVVLVVALGFMPVCQGALNVGDKVSFTLLQLTDVHHFAIGTDPSALYGTGSSTQLGGYARAATVIKRVQAENPNNILVDSGDFLMGTVFDWTIYQGPAAMKFMNELNFNATTLGNHEFDYGITNLSTIIQTAKDAGFNVPILSSNMIPDPVKYPAQQGLSDFMASGVIKENLVITLANGLKVGLLGILGNHAANDAPNASNLKFENDLSAPTSSGTTYIQGKVDYLRNNLGVDIVIAVSHSGIHVDADGHASGDDVTLAKMVTGIDIIASGHDHQITETVVLENNTRIICAGKYSQNLAQLDVNVEIGKGITSTTLTNNMLTADIAIDEPIQTNLINPLIAGIDATLLERTGIHSVNDIIVTTNSDNLVIAGSSVETGMGNLLSDSARYLMKNSSVPVVAATPSGPIRTGYTKEQQISFADIYRTVPLGWSPATDQNPFIPGYPMIKVYLTGEELYNLCQLAAYVSASKDKVFLSNLPAWDKVYTAVGANLNKIAADLSGGAPGDIQAYNKYVLNYVAKEDVISDMGKLAQIAFSLFNASTGTVSDACKAAATVYTGAASTASTASTLCKMFPAVAPTISTDFFLNFSGMQYTHEGMRRLYQVDNVKLYSPYDVKCSGAVTPVDKTMLYACVIDYYAIDMLYTPFFKTATTLLQIPIKPKDETGTPLDGTAESILRCRVDADPTIPGIQEVTEWEAYLRYLQSDQFPNHVITDADYGKATMNRVINKSDF
ncbi:MAG: hypothetical protein B6I31_00495 [Desulfobacteraceae bacterium 4572_19]|nr:MAG: hypothetical protein B6I31_00495 [Desulfobacteraceae bacterium 4572_19]